MDLSSKEPRCLTQFDVIKNLAEDLAQVSSLCVSRELGMSIYDCEVATAMMLIFYSCHSISLVLGATITTLSLAVQSLVQEMTAYRALSNIKKVNHVKTYIATC